MEQKYTREDLKIMQSWDLDRKIQVTQTRIMEWYNHFEGQVYVSFSGGKDSTVLLDLARRIYADIEAVFVDTGLEYPEVRKFVKSIENVTWLKPEMKFTEVILKHGYPVISKEVSRTVKYAKKGDTKSGIFFRKRLNGEELYEGKKSMYNCEKYKYLLDAPFDISSSCCDVMKKKPIHKYEKICKKKPIVGTMASESQMRKAAWLKNGCNSFNNKHFMSVPMSFWTEQDVLQYIKKYNIAYSDIYGDIVEDNGKLNTTGLTRTGCMFCMFGVHLEKEPNRFQRMKETHPKMWDYCIREENGLGIGKVLDFIDVKYE